MAYKEVFQKYLYELTASLPMNDPLFIASLATNKLLPGDIRGQIEGRVTQADKANESIILYGSYYQAIP